MTYTEHRRKVLDAIPENSLVLVYAGHPAHANEDSYLEYRPNSQFFWLTGLERAGMILVLTNIQGKKGETLYIDQFNPHTERWTGKMPTKEQAVEVSGIKNVQYTSAFDSALDRTMSRMDIRHVYFDTWKCSKSDLPDYNYLKAMEFRKTYPAVQLHDLHALVCPMREVKDAEELALIRRATDITKSALDYVMEQLKPGKYEYQVQADFEYRCRYEGAKRQAFTTIAGSGINGCMMHYVDNNRMLEDGDLILLDLGAEYNNYCSDITRTYPANGRYSPRQRQYYDIVLKANMAIKEAAKPGVTLQELNQVAQKTLAEGLIAMGKIKDASEIGKYYMHGCSHSIGVDVHDINLGLGVKLQPGWVISDEPGLYIDEEAIGIRIEDDLLITEDGAEYISKDIPRDADEIEAYMAAHNVYLKK